MSQQFTEQVEILNNEGDISISLNGESSYRIANITIGAPNVSHGELVVKGRDGKNRFEMNGVSGELELSGYLSIFDHNGNKVFNLYSNGASLTIGSNGNGGDLIIEDSEGDKIFYFSSTGGKPKLSIGKVGTDSNIIVKDKKGGNSLEFNGKEALLHVGARSNFGQIGIRDDNGNEALVLDGKYACIDVGVKGNEGDIRVRDNSGTARIHLDGKSGDIKLTGADCAEEFDVNDAAMIDPGTVLIINEDSKLQPSEVAYDKRVAGVVSGACGVSPGIILGKDPSVDNRVPIALNGKVFCKVSADESPIEVGDLLTTSNIHGYAMRVSDPSKAFGAVLGKAMAPFTGDKGVIPVLVALQ